MVVQRDSQHGDPCCRGGERSRRHRPSPLRVAPHSAPCSGTSDDGHPLLRTALGAGRRARASTTAMIARNRSPAEARAAQPLCCHQLARNAAHRAAPTPAALGNGDEPGGSVSADTGDQRGPHQARPGAAPNAAWKAASEGWPVISVRFRGRSPRGVVRCDDAVNDRSIDDGIGDGSQATNARCGAGRDASTDCPAHGGMTRARDATWDARAARQPRRIEDAPANRRSAGSGDRQADAAPWREVCLDCVNACAPFRRTP